MSDYLRGLWRLPGGVRRFLITEALYGIGIGLYSLVLNLHLLAKGLKEDQVGALVSAGILVMGLLAIPVSLLANRFGRKKLLVTGILFIAAGNILYAFTEAIAYFYVAQMLVSIGLTLVETTEVQLLFHYCASRRDEVRAFSLMFAVFTAFTGAGTLIAGYLPSGSGDGDGYRTALLLAGLVFILHGVIRGLVLPAECGGTRTADEPRAIRTQERLSDWKQKLPSAKMWLFALLLALLGGAIAITGSYLNVIVKFRLDWPDDNVSLLLAVAGIFLFASSLLTPYIMERFGPHRAIISVFLLNIALFAALFSLMPVWLFTVLFLIRGGAVTMLSNLVDSQLMSSLQEKERNLFAGMRSVFRSVGSSITAFAAGWILAGADYQMPFLFTAVVLGVGLICYMRWVRPLLD
ncbi:MFS transporter [Paenibacillus methanolicus]|uniref:Putative MFS family arabinose efflux permease n=1 Tax=Paenibacillus methanolicus TaxID=582686 RepID=A0A5S5C3W8_9BACL|nr:MFS transporter [Paenibacillus methanolicus]TYP74125.1 putative MFS family arabinose efflux permease [Paenibacillus methanolicus]